MEEFEEYKGIYNDNIQDDNHYEFGAHFAYLELYKRLSEIKSQHDKSNSLHTTYSNLHYAKNNFEIKKLSNVKFNFTNFFNIESRNKKYYNKTNRTSALSLIEKKKNKQKENHKPASVEKERTNSYNIRINNENSSINNRNNIQITKDINNNANNFRQIAKSRNRSFSNNKKEIIAKRENEEEKEANICCVNNNNCNYSKLVMLQPKERKCSKTLKHSSNQKNNTMYMSNDLKCLQSRNVKHLNLNNISSHINNYAYVNLKNGNIKSNNMNNSSFIINNFNPIKENKIKLLFLKKRGISNNHRNYRTNFSSSISKDKGSNSKTIFYHNIKHNYTKSSLSQQKTKYKINNLKYTKLHSYFNTNNSCSNTQKNQKNSLNNNNSTLSSSNNNNSQITSCKKNCNNNNII